MKASDKWRSRKRWAMQHRVAVAASTSGYHRSSAGSAQQGVEILLTTEQHRFVLDMSVEEAEDLAHELRKRARWCREWRQGTNALTV